MIRETRRALRDKIKLPAKLVDTIEGYLRGYEVIAKPRRDLGDPSDEWIIASAVHGSADIVVTGDHDLLDVARKLPVRTVSPRECWELVRRGRR